MDPTIALEEFRRNLEELGGAVENDDRYGIEDSLTAVQESFSALDGWLSQGGFLPSAWERSA